MVAALWSVLGLNAEAGIALLPDVTYGTPLEVRLHGPV